MYLIKILAYAIRWLAWFTLGFWLGWRRPSRWS